VLLGLSHPRFNASNQPVAAGFDFILGDEEILALLIPSRLKRLNCSLVDEFVSKRRGGR
jgi:hypothetical protein